MGALYSLAVGLHGGKHVRQIGQHIRKIFLDEKVHTVAAGGNKDIPLLLVQYAFILVFHDGSTHRRFFCVKEAQLLQGFPHTVDTHALIVGHEGGGQAHDDLFPALQEHFGFFRFVHDLLGILGTHHKTVAAEDALSPDDIGLIAGKADGFDRAMTDAFVAVLAVGFLQRQTVHGRNTSLIGDLGDQQPLRAPRGRAIRSSKKAGKLSGVMPG